jgi:DNA mismatch endonuclease (patch repair protein)
MAPSSRLVLIHKLCKIFCMADVFSRAKRSEIMRSIKPRGNLSTELLLVSLFKRKGIVGWRRHTSLLGRPDFCFRKERVTVFVDGDFWHGNPRTFKLPRTNSAFWKEKIEYNRAKDRRVTRRLRRDGWIVIRIWGSTLRRRPNVCVSRVIRALKETRE